MIFIKTYDDVTVTKNEILRYCGAKNSTQQLDLLIDECLSELKNKLSFKVCYQEFSVTVNEEVVDLGFLKIRSQDLIRNLEGCDNAIIFAATIGHEIDKHLSKHSRFSPSKALIVSAIGTAYVESLCDRFCDELSMAVCGENKSIRPRFSAGYGDLDVSFQKEIFGVLDCHKKIGLTLNDSMLMSPTKSVTAIVGIGPERKHQSKCENCNVKDCEYNENN